MCTVTFIPGNNSVLLTSNRDEKYWRSAALPPAIIESASGKILFPKDPDAGGTWLAAHENGNAIVFLNGGIQKHEPRPPYEKSRGLVLLDLIDQEDPLATFEWQSFGNIEPFTAIIYQARQLYECRWDGCRKMINQRDAHLSHIWSSVTLYDSNSIARRESWFRDWLAAHPAPTQDEALLFHQSTGNGDRYNDLVMNREGMVFTVSITSLAISAASVSSVYLDCKNHRTHNQQLFFTRSLVANP